MNLYTMDITISQIKTLRELTGAGVADCRHALEESNGDIKKAQELLSNETSIKAEKKQDREIKDGLVVSYIHGNGKIGVLLEMGCETDFVAKTADFVTLVHEIAMQVTAMDPANLEELLEQDYIRDGSKKIKDLISTVVAKTGENIKVGRFVRYEI